MTSNTEPQGKGISGKLPQLVQKICVMGEIRADQIDGKLGTFS